MLQSRIPTITQQASLRTQKAVTFAGEEVVFLARKKARKDTGDMAAGIVWKPGKDGHSGRVRGTDFKTRWNEYGTKKMSAQPMLRPAAHEAEAGFIRDMSKVYR